MIPGQHKSAIRRCLLGMASAMLAGGVTWADPPELKVTPEEGTFRTGRPFHVRCEVQWPGDPAAYAVPPVEIGAIDWGSVATGPSEATVRDGMNVVSQTITITPNQSGTFTLPEIKVALQGPEAPPAPATSESPTHPGETSVPQPLLSFPQSVSVYPDRTSAWVVGILGALPPFLLGIWLVRRKRRRAIGAEMPASPASQADIESALQAARQHRIDGDFYGFYRELSRTAEPLAPYDGELGQVMAERLRQTGYGGLRPSEDMMDGDFRAVERAFERCRAQGHCM